MPGSVQARRWEGGHYKVLGNVVLVCLAISALVILYSSGIQPMTTQSSQVGDRSILDTQGPVSSDETAFLLLKQRPTGCREVHSASDQCAFIRTECEDEEAGLLSYLDLYFCRLNGAKPVAFIIMIAWLGILFSSIGVSASDYLCVNLSTMANMLGMSQSLAGVTFLAFGNGSPDVFSTFAAMSTHSGSLAIGELVGAAGFITAVVAGSMAIVKPFKVAKKSFVRDVSFFTVAAAFSMVFLIDGHLTLWECIVMVAFYCLYVLTVLLWHSILHRRHKRQGQQNRARGHFGATSPRDTNPRREPSPVGLGDIEVVDPEDPEYEESQGLFNFSEEDREEDDETRERFLADIGQKMRTTKHRRTFSRMASGGQPIRPSLLGALEFGAVLSSLEKTRSQALSPRPFRRHSDDPSQRHNQYSRSVVGGPMNTYSSSDDGQHPSRLEPHPASLHPASNSGGRLRAVSANAADLLHDRSFPTLQPQQSGRDDGFPGKSPRLDMGNGRFPMAVPRILINNDTTLPGSPPPHGQSPVLTFPLYTDDPDGAIIASPADILQNEPFPRSHMPVATKQRWWAIFQMVPTLNNLKNTFLPTLANWGSKGRLDQFLSLVTAPTILILTLTIPVVDTEKKSPAVVVEAPAHSESSVPDEHILSESNAAQVIARSAADSQGTAATTERLGMNSQSNGINGSQRTTLHNKQTTSSVETSADVHSDDFSDESAWQPWLLAIHIFSAPLFLLFVFGVDVTGNFSQLRTWILFTPLGSLVVLILFLCAAVPGGIPAWHKLLAFPGFLVSIAWISLIANEVVGVLKAIGVITGISDAILGLTIFAVGNSCGDLFADLVIAKLGYPVMALSACFGGPMLNILLGIGVGGMYMTIRKGHKHSHGGSPPLSTHFSIEVGRTLIISGVGLLVTLIGLLIAVPLNGWMMDRKIGIALIALWCTTTIINVVLELVPT